ncbi:hypothetical protein NC796_02790 [Aliifodinibius sp. S!AR15-10]|uniref:hypothetical protein n=1 Tax=Aliifodinibius sp. S!AR15-10 TaxID=2950437 RepID=UPI0028574991|nr:hypothetical protein [Aliifodinibius sp. S!AR15-10]MDR8390050.1 hypothetical protein [Aliifodinibius sp. S!AR15-10]
MLRQCGTIGRRNLMTFGIKEATSFPYVKNGHIPWKIIGPFDHGGDLSRSFPAEDEIKDRYTVEGQTYDWHEKIQHGGKIHIKHFFRFPAPVEKDSGTVYALTYVHSKSERTVDFWIGFHNWSRSGGRRGGPTPSQGEWHKTKPNIWVNNQSIQPPHWENPGIPSDTPEIPFLNEDYYYRSPKK